MGDNPLDQAKQVTEVIGSIIQAAGENPEVKEAGKELGKAALTLAKSVNVVLLPLAAVNFGYDKAREYFSNKEKFEKEFSEKTAKIPPEDVIEPKPSVAGPVMQGLAFSHEEHNLKEMYLNLLANSMNRQKVKSIHPAFVEIIKQLSSEEIYFLNLFIKGYKHAIVEFRATSIVNGGHRFRSLKSHVLNIYNSINKLPMEINNVDTYVENWIRLGIFTVTYASRLADDSLYNWVSSRSECKNEPLYEGEILDHEKGIMERTAFGREFAMAIS